MNLNLYKQDEKHNLEAEKELERLIKNVEDELEGGNEYDDEWSCQDEVESEMTEDDELANILSQETQIEYTYTYT